uniref:Zinc-binding protein A33-like n=1 Tax=Ornithorhynchus anatinus TaxID=9258 RepID=A0A6I8N1C4_ORNAN
MGAVGGPEEARGEGVNRRVGGPLCGLVSGPLPVEAGVVACPRATDRGMAGVREEASLREELTCAICCDLFTEPVMLECLHHFCKECIQRYWASCPRVTSCPQCRRELPSRAFRRDLLVSGVVEKVKKCSVEERKRESQKSSGELTSKVRAAFERLHRILEAQEKEVLLELSREEEEAVMRLQGHIRELERDVWELERKIQEMHQALKWPQEEVASSARPTLPRASQPPFSLQLQENKYQGPLQYIFWRQMLRSVHPAPAPLTLDPESAHPSLVLSRDLTAVTEGGWPRVGRGSPRQFRQCVNVLAAQSFGDGSHYWEVWVGGKTKWDLGVAADWVDRTARVQLCPEKGYWALRLRNRDEYWAATTPRVRLNPKSRPRKLGVFLDCEEKTVAFYDAEDMSHLFSFHGAVAPRLCPFFSTCFGDSNENSEPMRICHLAP